MIELLCGLAILAILFAVTASALKEFGRIHRQLDVLTMWYTTRLDRTMNGDLTPLAYGLNLKDVQ